MEEKNNENKIVTPTDEDVREELQSCKLLSKFVSLCLDSQLMVDFCPNWT